MDKKINIQCFKNILSFLDIDTIKSITKICDIEKIIPNIIILDFIDDNLIEILGEKCICNNLFQNNKQVQIKIENKKINIYLNYLYRNKIYNDIFQQKCIKSNLFKCKSQSLIFMENEYNLLQLDDITKNNIKNICRKIDKIKIYYFTNGIDDQEYLNDTVSFL